MRIFRPVPYRIPLPQEEAVFMKKSVLFVAAVLVCVSAYVMLDDSAEAETGTVSDDSGSCGTGVTYKFESSTGTLTISGSGTMDDYISGSGAPWTPYSGSVKTVVIEDSVASIGGGAFYDCISLASVTIPDSVASIGYSAFEGCTSLASVTIPDSVTSIRNWAFQDCTSIASVNIPDNVASIEERVFSGCTSLASVTIGNSVTSIEQYAFEDCTSLTSVTVGESVTTIGYCSFSGCTSLTSVTIGNSVTSIEQYAFEECTSLTSVTVGESVTTIENSAFSTVTFYGADGTTKLDPTPDNLRGSVFRGTADKMVKQETYKVTFISVGGTNSVRLYAKGDTSVDEPANTVITGYTCKWPAYTLNNTDFSVNEVKTANRYTVTFESEGTILSAKDYDYGTPAEDIVRPADPSKAKDAQYTYAFAGWDSEIAAVTKDAVYTAVFTKTVNRYTVTFESEGTILSAKDYDYGTPAEDIVRPADPSKAKDAQYTYVFAGWDSEIAAVTKDATYTAVFTKTVNRYTVTFESEGTVLSSEKYDYGTPAGDIVRPADPSKDADTQYSYVFAGWDGYSEGMTVAGDVTFRAVFVSKTVSGSIFVIISESESVMISSAVADTVRKSAAEDESTVLKISAGKSTVVFGSAALKMLKSSDAELKITELSDSEKENMKEIVGNSPVYAVTFGTNTDFGGEKAALTVPYTLKEGQSPDNLEVWYISDGKAAEKFDADYNRDGYVTFSTGHFSDYAVMYIEPEEEGPSVTVVVIAIALFAVIALAAAAAVKKRMV